jgi:sec-independent protein translocase protein TatA
MRDIGPLEIGLIIVAIVLMFGVGKLGQIGGALGKSIREFRRERDKKDDPPGPSTAEPKDVEPAMPIQEDAVSVKHCPSCGGSMSANAKFCMECGSKVKSHAFKPW